MKRTVNFHKQGGNTNTGQVLGLVSYWLRDAANGSYILSFEKCKQQRSINQNQLMWLWFSCIAEQWSEAMGYTYTKDDVHDAYCMLFLPVLTPKGKIAGRTRGLTTEQMTEFLNRVQADAASEYGIELPNPTDEHFALWAEQYK